MSHSALESFPAVASCIKNSMTALARGKAALPLLQFPPCASCSKDSILEAVGGVLNAIDLEAELSSSFEGYLQKCAGVLMTVLQDGSEEDYDNLVREVRAAFKAQLVTIDNIDTLGREEKRMRKATAQVRQEQFMAMMRKRKSSECLLVWYTRFVE
jgi:hypothetical protein